MTYLETLILTLIMITKQSVLKFMQTKRFTLATSLNLKANEFVNYLKKVIKAMRVFLIFKLLTTKKQ